MKKQSLIKGSLILGLAGILTKLLGVFFRWPIIMILGDEGMGYYQMPFTIYMLFVSFAGGIPIAISKMVSESMAKNNLDYSFEIMRQAIKFMMALALVFTLALILGANYIISILNWNPKVYPAFIAMAVSPLMIGLTTAYRGFFQGMQNMYPTAVSQIIEQIGRVLAGVGLAIILLSYGKGVAAGGAVLGAGIGGLLSSFYMQIKYISIKPKTNRLNQDVKRKIMEDIFKISVPIGIGMLVGSFMALADSVLIPQLLVKAGYTVKQSTIIFAQFSGKANVIVNLPLSLSVALSASLIPVIAENYALKQFKELKFKMFTAMKFSFVIAFPSVLGLYFLAKPILNTIFPGQAAGYEILKYLSISIPFIILCQTTTAILQACNKLKEPIIFLIIGVVIKVLLNIYLIPKDGFGVYGAIIASVIAYLVPALLGIFYINYVLNKEFKEKGIRYFKMIFKSFIASAVMIFCVLSIQKSLLNLGATIRVSCLFSISIGIIIYLLLTIVLGIFKYDYIKNKFTKR